MFVFVSVLCGLLAPSLISYSIVVILLSDTMVRQAAMAFKCLLLIYYKNGRGHNFRRQVIWHLSIKNFHKHVTCANSSYFVITP